MSLKPKKIEVRIDYYLWTAQKSELFVFPTFIKTDKPFSNSLQEYLEECPYHKLFYSEFLLRDLSVLTSEGGLDKTFEKVRRVCSQTMSELTTGCRFTASYPNALSLEANLSVSRTWRDLFAGFCVDFETIQHSNGLIEELQSGGAQIKAIRIRADQLVQLSMNDFPILPTNIILLQDISAVSEQELKHIFNELPSQYKLTLSLKRNELELVANKLHILYDRDICFYLSRASTDMEPCLSDMIRTLAISLLQAGQLIHNGFYIASLSVYEESHFLDMLRLTDMRYAVDTPPKRVAIFGKRDSNPEDSAYQIAHEIGMALASKGFKVITGGYVGIMEAANSGAIIGGKNGSGDLLSEGVLAPNLFFRNIKGNKSLSKKYVTHSVNQRTCKLVEESSILVVMPGSVGTLTEFLVGLGISSLDCLYSIPGFPKVLIASRYPWESMLKSSWELMKAPIEQMDFIEYFDTPEEAIQLVEKKYELLIQYTQHV